VLQEAELSGQADSENNLAGSSETMYKWLDRRKRNLRQVHPRRTVSFSTSASPVIWTQSNLWLLSFFFAEF